MCEMLLYLEKEGLQQQQNLSDYTKTIIRLRLKEYSWIINLTFSPRLSSIFIEHEASNS